MREATVDFDKPNGHVTAAVELFQWEDQQYSKGEGNGSAVTQIWLAQSSAKAT